METCFDHRYFLEQPAYCFHSPLEVHSTREEPNARSSSDLKVKVSGTMSFHFLQKFIYYLQFYKVPLFPGPWGWREVLFLWFIFNYLHDLKK